MSQIDRLRTSMKNLRARSERELRYVVTGLESGASATAFGFVNGYFGDPTIGPVPLDLGVGLVGHLVAFWAGGDLSGHLHGLSNGAVDVYAARRTYVAGLEMRAAGLNVSVRELLGRREQGLNDDGTRPAGLPAAAP